jgi:hypothetical protein
MNEIYLLNQNFFKKEIDPQIISLISLSLRKRRIFIWTKKKNFNPKFSFIILSRYFMIWNDWILEFKHWMKFQFEIKTLLLFFMH